MPGERNEPMAHNPELAQASPHSRPASTPLEAESAGQEVSDASGRERRERNASEEGKPRLPSVLGGNAAPGTLGSQAEPSSPSPAYFEPGSAAPPAVDTPRGARKLTAYQVIADPPSLRKASSRRLWMDALPERFAYRCLPLGIANQLGWDLLIPATFTATWNGGPERWDVQIRWPEKDWSGLVRSHFGHGIVTFSTGYLFRTPPGIGLLACGPPNWPLDGAYPLAGVVETDWAASPFTMNVQLTRVGQPVVFEAGIPFCRVMPIDSRLCEQLDPELRLISDDRELEGRYLEWQASRKQFIEESRIQFSPAYEHRWQKEYFQGREVTGDSAVDHQTRLAHREFTDLRPPEARAIAPRISPGSIEPPANGGASPASDSRDSPAPARPDRATSPTSDPLVSSAPGRTDRTVTQTADPSLLTTLHLLRDLTDQQRVEILGRFCKHCGSEDPDCPCHEARAKGSAQFGGG